MKKNKIVHVISSLKVGGAELMLCDVIRGLQDYEHVVLFFHDGPVKARLQSLNIICLKIQKRFCIYDPWFLYDLFKQIKTIQPQVIMSSLWAANFLSRIVGKLLRIPTYGIIHAQLEHEGIVRNLLDAKTLHYADKVITVAPAIRDALIHKKWVDPKKIQVIANGIGLVARKTCLTRGELGLSEDDFVIGCVGRMVPVKNFALIIPLMQELLKHYMHVRAIIVGNGPLYTSLQKEIVALGLEKYIICVGEQHALDYYPLFDCFVQPSFSEGLSRALLEAMLYKLPIIINDGCAEKKFEHNLQCLRISGHNIDRWSAAFKQLIENKKLQIFLGEQAYLLAQHEYSYYSMISKYKQLLDFSCK